MKLIKLAVIAISLSANLVFAEKDHEHQSHFDKFDVNQDGKLSKEEFTALITASGRHLKMFTWLDSDDSEGLSKQEFARVKHRHMKPPKADFDAIDSDDDDEISKDELASHALSEGRVASIFSHLDIDGDGWLTKQEMRKTAIVRKTRKHHANFEDLDQNQDGVVDQGEVEAAIERHTTRARKRFSQMDQNGDGEITKEEFKSFKHEAKRKPKH